MSRLIELTKATLLGAALIASGCSDQAAQAQNGNGARAQIRESLGNAPASIDTTTAVRLSAAFRGAAEQVLPAVVHVRVTTQATAQRTRTPQRNFPFPFFDDDDPQQPRRGMGTGSGFVFDPQGYILTNNHVVANAERVLVTFVDGREYTARVIGADPNTDVGVIKIDPRNNEKFTPVAFGSSDDTHVGDWVIAIGNPLTLQFSVTAGIVSAKGRNLGILDREVQAGTALESFIQTDAAINPGNSGGPLIDLRGRVVGINSAIESPTGYFAGAGFAIPIDLARKVASDIIEYGHVRRPRLGVEVRGVTAADAEAFRLPAVEGAIMASVQPGQPAARAGIEMGDVVVGLNGHPIRTQTQFMEELARLRPGERARLDIIRYGQRLQKTVELGEFENNAKPVAQRAQRPRTEELLGFSVMQVTPELAQRLRLNARSGIVVHEVDDFSPARPYLITGTQILKINGRDVSSVQDVERVSESLRPGQVVSLVVRNGTGDPRIVNYRVR
ncbi:MAG TPA: Do family serine endopeptidase [Longimicrobiales bacterium]|nr:Do family serine endopeptidase [Longimicrobiales bacterium]